VAVLIVVELNGHLLLLLCDDADEDGGKREF
jgi:hypothetical protein